MPAAVLNIPSASACGSNVTCCYLSDVLIVASLQLLQKLSQRTSAFVCSVMVLKKLGDELTHEFHSVVHYLGHQQGMQVVVEPQEHKKLVSHS